MRSVMYVEARMTKEGHFTETLFNMLTAARVHKKQQQQLTTNVSFFKQTVFIDGCTVSV